MTLKEAFKKAYKSKTVWLGVAIALLSVVNAFIVQIDLSPAAQASVGGLISSLIIVLRFMTTLPLSDK